MSWLVAKFGILGAKIFAIGGIVLTALIYVKRMIDGFKEAGRNEERARRLQQQAQDVARANRAGATATDDDLLSPTDRNRK